MKRKVAIIGGGINGLMCAYFLLRQGFQVTVFDKGPIPNPASASFGMHRLIHPWSDTQDPSTAARAETALGLWKTILAQIHSQTFIRTGVLAVVPTKAGMADKPVVTTHRLSAESLQEKLPFGPLPDGMSGVLYPDFGFLLASQILADIAAYLQTREVALRPNTCVHRTDGTKGCVTLADGEALTFDHTILCAGTGAGSLLARSDIEIDAVLTSKRCYVVYVSQPNTTDRAQKACWASLGKGDLWGMPAFDRFPLKLGSGAFTHPRTDADIEDAELVGPKILEEYASLFPQMRGAGIIRSACNHWTAITTAKHFVTENRTTVVMSDNGGGFKFAPLIGQTVANSLHDQVS